MPISVATLFTSCTTLIFTIPNIYKYKYMYTLYVAKSILPKLIVVLALQEMSMALQT